jgi:hypothetical protein
MRPLAVFFKRMLKGFLKVRKDQKAIEDLVKSGSELEVHKKNYREFLKKFKLRKFQSASEIALKLNFDFLSDREKLVIVRCYYSSRYGVIADQILENLCQKLLVKGENNLKLIITLLDRIMVSGLDSDFKISVFDEAKAIFYANKHNDVVNYYAFIWMYYSFLSQKYDDLNPKSFIEEKDVEQHGVELIARFIPALKAFGYESYVDSLMEALTERTVQSLMTLNLLISYSKVQLDTLKHESIAIPLTRESISFLPVLLSGCHYSDVINQKYEELFEYIKSNFERLDIYDKDTFLRFLVKNGRYHEVSDLSRHLPVTEQLLASLTARGYLSINCDDNHTARACFESVLTEDPGDALAATGMRFALPRTGRHISELLNLRDRIGYGVQGYGRVGIRNIGSELTISLLMSGEYIKGQYSKAKAKHWITLKNYYGKRFLNFERLNSPKTSSVFIIGDEGVGDEIRTAQFYCFLSEKFNDLTITCEPRLYNIFRQSFPNIKFIPVARAWKLVNGENFDHRERLNGFGDKIANYLTEDCRKNLNSSDVVTFGQNIFFNYVINEIPRPTPGPYLALPKSKEVIPKTETFKLGILWRSHLRVGARKMMYLDLADFAPLFDFSGIELWSIQHSMDPDEAEYCRENGVRLIDDVDMFNDFEGLGNYLQGLDLLVGVSSLPMELGAALGVETWMLGFSPENFYLRTAGGKVSEDQYTLNSTVIAPPWIDFSNPRSECVKQVFEEVVRRLELKFGTAGLEACANEKL